MPLVRSIDLPTNTSKKRFFRLSKTHFPDTFCPLGVYVRWAAFFVLFFKRRVGADLEGRWACRRFLCLAKAARAKPQGGKRTLNRNHSALSARTSTSSAHINPTQTLGRIVTFFAFSLAPTEVLFLLSVFLCTQRNAFSPGYTTRTSSDFIRSTSRPSR